MSSDFKYRKFAFSKEREVVNKISTLLKVLTNSEQKRNQRDSHGSCELPKKKFSMRARSFCPRVTMFDFVSSKLVKPPVVLNAGFPEIVNPPATSMKKYHKVARRKERTFMLPIKFQRKVVREESRGESHRFRRILELTEEMINKENFEGWN